MKRKTKNACLLETIKRQERYVRSLQEQIAALEARESIRDEAWQKHTDKRIKEINTIIRTAKSPKDVEKKIEEILK